MTKALDLADVGSAYTKDTAGFGFRNKIINGDCRVAQRASSVLSAAPGPIASQ